MSDIFISYSSIDRDQIKMLAAFLESEGYRVWWDHNLVGGDSFRRRILEELTKARAAIVVWTENSIGRSGETGAYNSRTASTHGIVVLKNQI